MTDEVTIELTDSQWRIINRAIQTEAKRLGIIPKGATAMGITTPWGSDNPTLVFDMEDDDPCFHDDDCGCANCAEETTTA